MSERARTGVPQQTHGRIAINMAKQTLNANISSSSEAGVNVDYGFEWTVEIWNSMDADICNIRLAVKYG